MARAITRRAFVSAATAAAALAGTACTTTPQQGASSTDTYTKSVSASKRVEDLLGTMSLEQKIAQMIMLAIRTWEGKDNGVTDLSAVPDLAAALQKHQYGGVILLGVNIRDTKQTLRLISDLQTNNAKGAGTASTSTIPYFVAADQEGGSVARLNMGTRGTGSMAIGATGEAAAQNAQDTGTVFGTELASLGINVNLAPCVDVICDLADSGMSTRIFSDDPKVVTDCALGFAQGVSKAGVVTCYKHFPGAGDGSDDPTAIPLTIDELQKGGLIPYSAAIGNGAAMVMTSACTFPSIDDEVTLADGKTRGYYPATISPKIVSNMLRGELGFKGVIMTDALEMDQFFSEPKTGDAILPGARVENAIAGTVTGDEGASTRIYIDRYYDLGEGALVWGDGLSDAIAKADYVICLCATWAGLDKLQDSDGRMQGVTRALNEAHAAKAKFVLLSDNLPVDGARFPEADAVVCCYLSTGFDVDPTTGSGSENMRAINANAPAALRAIFGSAAMPGKLPINVRAMKKGEDGKWTYTGEVLYARGTGA